MTLTVHRPIAPAGSFALEMLKRTTLTGYLVSSLSFIFHAHTSVSGLNVNALFVGEGEQVVPGMNYSHNLNLRPCHESEALTNITLNFEGCIDYIFYEENSFELLKEYPPPDKASIAKITGCQEHQVSLPNLIAPSDHLPIIADFKLT